MASESVSLKHLNDITECAICAEVFVDHRALPCIHSFCLKCLESCGKDKKPGEMLPCPICRKEFAIPEPGMAGLQRNFFIDKLLDVKKRLHAHGSSDKTCDWCSSDVKSVCDSAADKLATKYCIQCNVSYCDQCAKGHDRNPALRRHKLEDIGAPIDEENLLSMLPASLCDKHQEVVDVYCRDCQKAMCIKCYLKDHKTHAYSDIVDEASAFRQQMEKDVEDASGGIARCDNVAKNIKTDIKEFDGHISRLKLEVSEKATWLHQLIDSHKDKLIHELEDIRYARTKKMHMVEQEVEIHMVRLESFKRYCSEVKSKGTDSDATRAAGDLHKRAMELGEFDVDNHVHESMLKMDVTFKPSTLLADGGVVNAVGVVEMQQPTTTKQTVDDNRPNVIEPVMAEADRVQIELQT